MAQDADEIVIASTGKVMTAPLGTVAPVTSVDAWPAEWLDAGMINEDGVTFRDSKTTEKIPIWQSLYPARRVITERDTQLEFVLRQWSKITVPLAFGGGEVTEPTPGNYRFEGPDAGDIDERQLGIEWVDGDKHYRLIVAKGMVEEAVESQLTRTSAADLPITFGATPDAGQKPFYLLTDDPAFEAAV